MSAALQVIEPSKPQDAPLSMQIRNECQQTLEALITRTPAIVFASLAMVDGRSFAHADAPGRAANAARAAAIMSSLMGLIESFSRESLDSRALYNSIATAHGSIVLVRVPSKAKLHTLCICADGSEILAMTIRAALDTAGQLAARIDADT
ncbi:MAG: hypothetical protein ACTHOH_15880 [Lysobacteraceae bacterium]